MAAGARSTVRRGSSMRVAVWVLHLAAPLLALWLLIAQPSLDVAWHDNLAHFVLVFATAGVCMVLGYTVDRAARERADARLFLVSLVFLCSAGFLGLHALATPGVLLDDANRGFSLATPVGLVLGGIAALASSAEFTEQGAARLMRMRLPLALAPWVLLGCWAAVSLGGLPPLEQAPDAAQLQGLLLVAALVGCALYTLAAVRYLVLYRRRPAVVLLSVLTAFVLLAEALVAVAFARSWQASWWLWHVLMTLGFAFIVYSAHVQFRREGTSRGVFDSVALRQTITNLHRDYAAALEQMVAALARRARGDRRPLGPMFARLAQRFDLTEQQVAVLERAAHALGQEREQVRRLGGLVAVGREASVIQSEPDLLGRVATLAADAFHTDQLRLIMMHDGRLDAPDGNPGDPVAEHAVRSGEPAVSADGTTIAVPLSVKATVAGVLRARRPEGGFTDADRALLRSFASQASMALENARLYHQLDGLFRSYMSPAVATALLADPEQAGLGGRIADVTVLMADLHGFTPFAERESPEAVVDMLNTYYGAVVPVLLEHGGTVVQFVGDAVMALFNAPVRQPDHALRAVRAGLGLHIAVAAAATGHDGWPRFRVGINSGPALVGNIGAAQMRNFTAIGDTTNLAARLESLAEPGEVVIGPGVRERIGAAARLSDRGVVTVKGKREPVPVYVLHEIEHEVH